METPQTPAIETPQTGTPPVASVETPAPTPAPEMPSDTAQSFESGGLLPDKGNWKWVYYLTFGVIVSASIYSIYYHRQALQKIDDNPSTSTTQKKIQELENNLKSILGSKYVTTS